MSYDVCFEKDGNKCFLPNGVFAPSGGTYCFGGTQEAWLNITYNYYEPYSRYNFGITNHDKVGEKFLEGKTAAECICILNDIIPKLGTDSDEEDYWNPTEGNARIALEDLLFIAKNVPSDSICKVY